MCVFSVYLRKKAGFVHRNQSEARHALKQSWHGHTFEVKNKLNLLLWFPLAVLQCVLAVRP